MTKPETTTPTPPTITRPAAPTVTQPPAPTTRPSAELVVVDLPDGWRSAVRPEPNPRTLKQRRRRKRQLERLKAIAQSYSDLTTALERFCVTAERNGLWSGIDPRDLRTLIAVTAAPGRAVLAERDARVKAEGIAEGLSVAAAFLREQFDYWDGRPLAMHGPHLWSDFRAVLDAIERRAEHVREGQA